MSLMASKTTHDQNKDNLENSASSETVHPHRMFFDINFDCPQSLFAHAKKGH
jgi:hypothetical protein